LPTSERINFQFVDLLSQRHAFAGTQGFAPFIWREVCFGEVRFWEQILLETAEHVSCVELQRSKPVGEILVAIVRQNALLVKKGTRVKPGDSLDWRLIKGLIIGYVRVSSVVG